jgi:DNA-binding PadR family transcriptional regulator
MTIETKDLWQSAYLLAEGGWLSRVKVQRRNDGKREVVFQLTGDGVEDLARRFVSGQAVCNVTKLKAQLNHLKDVIFGGAHSGIDGEACGVSNGD